MKDEIEKYIVRLLLTFIIAIATVYGFAQWYIQPNNMKYLGIIGFILIAILSDQTTKNIMKYTYGKK